MDIAIFSPKEKRSIKNSSLMGEVAVSKKRMEDGHPPPWWRG
jgi:hypothetical protein